MYYLTWGWPVLAALVLGIWTGWECGKFYPDFDQNAGGPLLRIGVFVPVLSLVVGFALWLLTQRLEPYRSAHWTWVALPALAFLVTGLCAGLYQFCTGGRKPN